MDDSSSLEDASTNVSVCASLSQGLGTLGMAGRGQAWATLFSCTRGEVLCPHPTALRLALTTPTAGQTPGQEEVELLQWRPDL